MNPLPHPRVRTPSPRTRLSQGILLCLATLIAAPALADESTSSPQHGEATNLGAVKVTARKRDERQIDVPIAMTAITGEQIDAMGITKVAEIIAMTPGAGSVDNGGGFTQVQIRGVSTWTTSRSPASPCPGIRKSVPGTSTGWRSSRARRAPCSAKAPWAAPSAP